MQKIFNIKLLVVIFILLALIFIVTPKANAEQQITVKEYPSDNKYFDGGYILVDIKLDDVHDLRSYCGSGTFSELVEQAQEQEEGEIVLAINGDYWNYMRWERIVVRNGEVLYELEKNSKRDYCVITHSGIMRTYPYTMENPNALKDCWQLFSFGPRLVHRYKAILNYEKSFDQSVRLNSHPRTAIGYYEKNHFCFLIVYGRNLEDHGCYLEDMAQFFVDLGCKEAYNLDGGSSSHIWYQGQEIGKPNGDKPLSDIIYIRK